MIISFVLICGPHRQVLHEWWGQDYVKILTKINWNRNVDLDLKHKLQPLVKELRKALLIMFGVIGMYCAVLKSNDGKERAVKIVKKVISIALKQGKI